MWRAARAPPARPPTRPPIIVPRRPPVDPSGSEWAHSTHRRRYGALVTEESGAKRDLGLVCVQWPAVLPPKVGASATRVETRCR
eukprot:scaffold71316_cov25-Tisochrysis_lutea.AAC.2